MENSKLAITLTNNIDVDNLLRFSQDITNLIKKSGSKGLTDNDRADLAVLVISAKLCIYHIEMKNHFTENDLLKGLIRIPVSEACNKSTTDKHDDNQLVHFIS